MPEIPVPLPIATRFGRAYPPPAGAEGPRGYPMVVYAPGLYPKELTPLDERPRRNPTEESEKRVTSLVA